MLIPVQFAVASNDGRSDMLDGASLVNLFAETLPPDAKTKVALYGTPGQSLFATVPTSPIKAMEQLDGVLYIVTSTALYRVTSTGVVTSIGSVVMSGNNVSIASNSIHIAFVDGTKGYYYSVAGGLHEFTGDGWYPANTVTSQDGYFIFNRAGTGQFFFTGILDTSLDPLDFATAEAAPDDTLGVLSDQASLWLFGEKSIEIWYDDGVSPFSRMHGAYIETGIGAVHSAVQMANSIFLVGDNGIVFRTQGYSLVRVSNHAIEYQFLRGDISGAYAYSYIEEGHHFYVLTIPSINRTCVYDSSTDLWHERSHSVHGRHNGKCYARFSNKQLIGDYHSGNIYELSMSSYTDHGSPIVREAVSPVIHANNNRATMWGFNLDVEDSGLEPITYSDWFLPSKSELEKLFLARSAIGLSESWYYWSSSEVNATTVYALKISDGTTSPQAKSNGFRVRQIRYAVNSPGTTAAIGDLLFGGIVAYIFTQGDFGYNSGYQTLIISESVDIAVAGFSNIVNVSVGGTLTAIGYGFNNSTLIAGQLNHTVSAAKLCLDYSVTKQTGAAPKVSLQFSDDAGITWSSPRERVFGTSQKNGRVARWNALGQFVHRKIKIKTSNSVAVVLGGAYAEVNRDN